MTGLLTAAQMRSREQAAIASGAVSGLDLMERAGRGVVDAVLAHWPALAGAPQRALVLCGPGNNGGDGFVVARLLRDRGWQVATALYGDAGRLPPDAAHNLHRWQGSGGEVRAWSGSAAQGDDGAALIVDALFGTGLTRPLADDLWPALAALNLRRDQNRATRTVAVDVPSGLCADSGRALGDRALVCDLTVTFHAARPGHHLSQGPRYCGAAPRIVDIGLRGEAAGLPGEGTGPLREADVRTRLAQPDPALAARSVSAHKYTHGHALVLSGPANRTGASRLAARGALRVGAGLVTVGAHPDAMAEHAAQLTAIMLRQMANDDALRLAIADPRLTALCLGPAMGVTARTRAMVLTALQARRATVLDADALTVFAEDPPTLFEALHDACVLTPHDGEFARLFPDIAARLAEPATSGPAYSRLDAVRAAAARAGCVVLCKGADTVIAAPDGWAAISSAHYDRAAPWLATAGSGDVLAGMVTGLMARGMAPHVAAETAAWLHVECALQFGPGLIADDLPQQVPGVLRGLLSRGASLHARADT